MGKFAIGVDLGGTNLRVAAVNDHGETADQDVFHAGLVKQPEDPFWV